MQSFRSGFCPNVDDTRSTDRFVKIAAIQTAISSKVPFSLNDQKLFFEKIKETIEIAARNGTNIIAFPELFCEFFL